MAPNLKFVKKERFQIFFHKKGGFGKKRSGYHLFSYKSHTMNSFQFFLSLSDLCACVSFVYFYHFYQYSFYFTEELQSY